MLKNLKNIKDREPNILGHEKYQKFAVILPLINYFGQDCILFEVRSQTLKNQPGEICFPGGYIEPSDKNAEAAAIRETCEELGINKSDIKVIGPLDILITPFNTMLSPFVAQINDHKKINTNKSEVESIFYVPLEYFFVNEPQTYINNISIQPSPNFPTELLPNGKTYNWRSGFYPVHFYVYENRIIWGMTARIVNHFIQLLKKA